METSLKSGNSGNVAKVDTHKRLHVDAITFGRSEQEAELGNGYNINTGIINLTSASKSAVAYFKNNEDIDIVISGIFLPFGKSNAPGDMLVSILRNPTAGTIVSGAVVADMPAINRNFGSNFTLDADTYKGAEANTFTDGGKVIETLVQDGRRTALIIGDIILPKGSSIGFEITPPTGNTGMDIQVAFNVFLDTLKDIE